MNQEKQQTPRIRDDSETRALMLGSKACSELRLEAQNVDWRKFLEEIGQHRQQGRNESEIDWKTVLGHCVLTIPRPAKGFRAANLVDLLSLRRLVPEIVRLAAAVILVLALSRTGEKVTDLSGELRALRQENEILKQEYSQLQSDLERSNRLDEQLQQRLAGERQVLEDKITRLQARNNAPKTNRGGFPSDSAFIAIRDSSGQVTVSRDGTVVLPEDGRPPAQLSRLVSELATTGWVSNSEAARAALESLRTGETRGGLSSVDKRTTPLPFSPLSCAVRSASPTLRWKPVAGEVHYKITVAYPEQKENGRVIWRSSSIAGTEVTLPSNLLQRGEAYLWQVEAVSPGNSHVSPAAGFWVIGDAELREIEAAERNYNNGDLVLASVYETSGLYEEALSRVEKLLALNPTNPLVREMSRRLRVQLNRE